MAGRALPALTGVCKLPSDVMVCNVADSAGGASLISGSGHVRPGLPQLRCKQL